MPVCSSCGKEVSEDMEFCPECGNRLIEKQVEQTAGLGSYQEIVNGEPLKPMNWFERHLNWTMVLAWAGSYVVILIVGSVLAIRDPYLLGILPVIWLTVSIVLGRWVLRRKNRSMWWLFISWTIFFLLIRNKSPRRHAGKETASTESVSPSWYSAENHAKHVRQPGVISPTQAHVSPPLGTLIGEADSPMAQNWSTVRVFISSTFRDMHAERNYLVRVVFPELRERCAKRRLHLIDLDLRWGVTEEEAEAGKVLEIILDEIDRSRPFFIGILGERYGSVPDKTPDEVGFAYPWLRDYPGHSITGLEIVHAVLRNPSLAQRSFFYFRDPHFMAHVPDSKRADFVAENPEAIRKLAALKDKIRASGRSVLENYPCRWDEVEERLVDLDVFGQRVLEDLWTAICVEYPEEAPAVDPLAVERQMHEAFAEERSRLHIGRTKEATRLTKYVQGQGQQPVVITGESGCGKSAFLASWYRRYSAEHPDDFVLAYFIGASPDSTDHLRLLRNMCQELKRKFALKQEIPQDDRKLPDMLATLLAAASQNKPRIVIILDALDQLSVQEGAHGLGWLLDYVPHNVRLIVSALPGDCLDALRWRQAEEIGLPPLTTGEQRQIMETLLSEWRRKLDDRQMAALLAHPGVKNPLYLRVALEELRLFGKFEQLTARINELPENIPGLFDQVLARLEEDHRSELVVETFALVGCSRYGLSEVELLELLPREGEQQFPRALWARLVRGAKAYLVQRGELLGFFHWQLSEAVATRYLNLDNKHAKLAAYFEHAPLERKLDEYPYQLQHAEQWENLAAALTDLDFFSYAWKHNRKHEWMDYWRSLEGRFEPGPCYQAAIEAKERAEGATHNVAVLLNRVGLFLHDMAAYPTALLLAERALRLIEHIVGPDTLEAATCLNNLATLYQQQGRYTEALPLVQRALAIRQRTLSPDHPDIATSLNSLAGLYKQQGKHNEVLPLFEQALAIKEKTLGPNHSEVATSLNNLAGFYKEQGAFAEALPLYQRALVIKERTLTPDHPDVAIGLSNLAGVYKGQGNYAQALPLYQRALAIQERVFGPAHPNVATSLNNLGQAYYEQGNYAEALPLLKRALAIEEGSLGSDHPTIATTLSNLAALYNKQGNYAEALPLLKRALAIGEHALGSGHPQIAYILNNLGLSYHEQGNYAEAMPLLKRALSIEERSLGPNHPTIANTLSNLAELYKKQRSYTEALTLYQRALAIGESAFGPSHPLVANILNNLGGLHYEQGDYARALPLFKRAVTIVEAALGTDNHVTKVIRTSLEACQDAMRVKRVAGADNVDVSGLNRQAAAYYKEGQYAQASSLYQRVLAVAERALGPTHPEVATILNNLAMAYRKQGMNSDALPLLKRALEIFERAFGKDHPSVALGLNNLGGFYLSQSSPQEAMPLLQRALRIRENALEPDHLDVALSLNNLAEVYKAQGKYPEALPLYRRAVAIAEAKLGRGHNTTCFYRGNMASCERALQ